jgi:hypothetical protein
VREALDDENDDENDAERDIGTHQDGTAAAGDGRAHFK